MNILKKLSLIFLSIFGLATHADSNAQDKSPSEAMRALRLQALSTPAKEFGLSPSEAFPKVYGVVIDFPIDEHTATIVSLSDGTASLYTTSTFGIIGGGSHDSVNEAAKKLVSLSDQLISKAVPSKDFSYPKKGMVRFYFLSYDGVKAINTKLSAIESDKSEYSPLFWQAQEVLTQLRLSTEAE